MRFAIAQLVVVTWRGTLEYGETLAQQRAYREAVIARTAPEALWLLEHPPVITTGRREANVDAGRIRGTGFDLVATERGGLATCHEPGQLVGYLFVDVSGCGVRRLVGALQGAIVAWLAGFGVDAGAREGLPGVWVGSEKVCALGLHVKRGITMHGFALNLVNDLSGFGLISPCGLREGCVTTLARLVSGAPTPEAAAPSVGVSVVSACAAARVRPFDALDTLIVEE